MRSSISGPEPGAPDTSRFCSSCGRPIVVADASFCKDCGGAVTGGLRLGRNLGWDPRKAALLSIVPGLGHWYKGRRALAIVWFVAVALSYTVYPFGMMLHLICAANAALGDALYLAPQSRPESGRGENQDRKGKP